MVGYEQGLKSKVKVLETSECSGLRLLISKQQRRTLSVAEVNYHVPSLFMKMCQKLKNRVGFATENNDFYVSVTTEFP